MGWDRWSGEWNLQNERYYENFDQIFGLENHFWVLGIEIWVLGLRNSILGFRVYDFKMTEFGIWGLRFQNDQNCHFLIKNESKNHFFDA